jgi:DNA-binding transcriptional LysR family regulator
MGFVGQRKPGRAARRGAWPLAELAQGHELLTFQRGSQPHVALLELCRRQGVDAARVHCISSISAMVELVEQGFGVATLPAAAVKRLAASRPLVALRCESELQPLPIQLSWREDPAAPIVRQAVDSVFTRAGVGPRSAKKSMRA